MSRKHRHFLAAPLFALSLLVTIAGVSGAHRAQVTQETVAVGEITAVRADKTFTLPRGLRGLLREDGVLHDDGGVLSLRQGTVLVASDGMTTVQIGDVFLSAFHGGFLATFNGTKFSVHALTSPVLLERGAFRLIIPAGMQGSWTAAEQLPSGSDVTGIAAERERLQMIPEGTLRDELSVLAALPPAPLPHSPEDLRMSLQFGDATSLRALLRQRAMQTALQSPELSTEVLSTLFADTADLPSASQELLQYLRDDRLWLLLSFHRSYRAAAWENSGAIGISADARVLRWLQLPSSDVGGNAVSALAVERWAQQVGKYAESLSQPQDFLEPLLRSLRGYRAFAEQRGFPERLQRIAHALRAVIEPFNGRLSDDAKNLYAEWQELDNIEPYTEPAPLPPPVIEAAVPVPVPAPVPGPFDAAAVEAGARQMLLDAGALFTTQTVLHAESATQVTVQHLLFATGDGEHRYDAVLDLTARQLRSIRRDGQLMPYSPGLDAFGAWAGGQPPAEDGGR